MENPDANIRDILTTEYSDFLDYCALADKKLAGEITSTDYIAFRSQFGVSREVVSAIRKMIENYSPDESEDTPPEADIAGIDDSENNPVADIKHINSDTVVVAEHEKNGTNTDKQKKPTLAEIIGVENAPIYDDVKLSVLDLNVRANNALFIAKRDTLGALLQCTLWDLQNMPRIGGKTTDNILRALSEYFGTQKHRDDGRGDEGVKKCACISTKVFDQVQYMLKGEAYTTEGFSENELFYFTKCVEARDVSGAKICLLASKGDSGLLNIYRTLKQYENRVANTEEIKKKLSSVSTDMSRQPVRPYWKAYYHSILSIYDGETLKKEHIDQEAYSVLSDGELIIESLPDKIRLEVHSQTGLKDCLKFVQWLGNDFIQMIRDSITECLRQWNEKCVYVLKLRAGGETLNKAGEYLKVSRERTRQLEAKAIRCFMWQYHRNQCDIILIISAIRGGDLVLRRSEIREHLSEEDTNVFWYLVSKGKLDCQMYHYSGDIDAVVLEGADKEINVAKFLEKKLPDGILASELDSVLTEISGGNISTKELLYLEAKNRYRISGQYLHRGRLTVTEICDYILKNRFPNGYKIDDADYERKFRYHMKEIFGEIKVLPSGHSIDTKMAEVGMLSDRGKYIHPSCVHIEQDTIDRINAYISNSARTVLTFGEIFDAMSDELSGTEITNKYILQGALNQYDCPYTTRRDYVTKDDSRNMAAEVTQYIKEQGMVHKSALSSEFSFSDARLGQVLARCPEVIVLDDGYFMHSRDLIVSDEEVKNIREYITSACAAAPISTRAMLDDFNLKFTDFVMRNDIRHHGKLYGILQYLFNDVFCFSRPYISIGNTGGRTREDVLFANMDGVESIEIDDLSDLCQSAGIYFATHTDMISTLRPDKYVRINETTIMRSDVAGITKDVIMQTTEMIKEELDVHRYYPANKITDFGWYPEINVEWTPYLVESIMNSRENNVASVRILKAPSALPAAIFLSEEYADEDYRSLVMRLLSEEHCREPFTSKEQVLDWLRENGLCFEKLPYFLNDDKHLYKDENGLFRIGY